MKIEWATGTVELVRLPIQRFGQGLGFPTIRIERNRFGVEVRREIIPPECYLKGPST